MILDGIPVTYLEPSDTDFQKQDLRVRLFGQMSTQPYSNNV